MDYNLTQSHSLFRALATQNPGWWQNLKKDKDLYIDIRKDNYLNVYHNGGSLMRLHWDQGFKAEIHYEYIPLKADRAYLPYEFEGDEARLTSPGIIDIDNFAAQPLARIKKRIKKFFSNNSEKGLQGRYITWALQAKRRKGFFLDSEFEYRGKRMDLVWVDLERQTIAFVELKRMSDHRLIAEPGPHGKAIAAQLKKYAAFIQENASQLLEYYDLVYRIKKDLGLLPGFSKRKSLLKFTLLSKPILLVGDCTQDWIDHHAPRINAKVSEHAFGCVYHGPSTFSFRIPFETAGNSYCFEKTSRPSEYCLPLELRNQKSIHDIYPELAEGAEVPNGPLPIIKLKFAESFLTWGISLPEDDVVHRRRGKICKAGWAIWYLFGSDETGEYLDLYSAHRMTNDCHDRIYEDGRTEALPSIADFRRCSEDPEEDARLKKEQHEEDLRVMEILEAKGFGVEGDEPPSVQIQRYQRVQGPEE